MEGHFFVMQMLLMLIATAFIAYPCSCFPQIFDYFRCDPELSVIKARVISAEMVKMDGKPITDEEKNDKSVMKKAYYLMQLQETFQTGSNNISTSNSSIPIFSIGSFCGVVLDTNTEYLLVGKTDLYGKFNISMCEVIVSWDNVTKSTLDLLKDQRAPDCKNATGRTGFNIRHKLDGYNDETSSDWTSNDGTSKVHDLTLALPDHEELIDRLRTGGWYNPNLLLQYLAA